MKTYNTVPAFNTDQFIKLDHIRCDYGPGSNEAPQLLQAWIKNEEDSTPPFDTIRKYRLEVICHFGAMFLFECGRIYGIRQERARRKGEKK